MEATLTMASEKIEITKDSYPDFVNTFRTFPDSSLDEIRWQLTGSGSDDSLHIDITLLIMEGQPQIRLTLENAFEVFLIKVDRYSSTLIGRMDIHIQDDYIMVLFNGATHINMEIPLGDFTGSRHFKCRRLWWEYL